MENSIINSFRLLLPARGRFGPCPLFPLPGREKCFSRLSSSASPSRQPGRWIGHLILQAESRGEGPCTLRRAGPPRSRLAQSRDHSLDASARGQRRAFFSWFALLFLSETGPNRHGELRAAPLRPPVPLPDLERDPTSATRRNRKKLDLDLFFRERSFLFRPFCADALRLGVRLSLPPPLSR